MNATYTYGKLTNECQVALPLQDEGSSGHMPFIDTEAIDEGRDLH